MSTHAGKALVGRLYFYSDDSANGAPTGPLFHGERLSETQLAHLECNATSDIYPGDQFHVGRFASECRIVVSDPSVSLAHLRFHCVPLGTSCSGVDLQCLVYVEDISTNGAVLYRSSYSPPEALDVPKHTLRLLENNDQIRICSKLTIVYRECDTYPKQLAVENKHQTLEKQYFTDDFIITDRLIGQGGYGSVYLSRNKKTHQHLACKVINMNNTSNATLDKLSKFDNEFKFLLDLDHPNIVYLEKVFKSNHTIYMFQELLTGGDLFAFVESSGGKLSDGVAAIMIQQILQGVSYLHSQNIVHRDLKPDNILLTKHSPGARVVITDFGHARKIKNRQNRIYSRPVGTYEYAAPEISGLNAYIDATKGYTIAVDMWSVGTIAAMLLTGYMLFSRPSDPTKYREKERQSYLNYLVQIDNCEEWLIVGKKPKDFIKQLLTLNEKLRPTANQALEHEWFADPEDRERFELISSLNLSLWSEYQKCRDRSIVYINKLSSGGIDHSRNISMIDSSGKSSKSSNGEFRFPSRSRFPSEVLGHDE